MTGSAGFSSRRDHELATRGVRVTLNWGLHRSARAIAAGGARHGGSRDLGPWFTEPLLGRLERGDSTRKRRRVKATSPPRGLPHGTRGLASALSRNDAPTGARAIRGRARGSQWIAEAGRYPLTLREQGDRAPRKRGDANGRRIERASCASSEPGRRGEGRYRRVEGASGRGRRRL